MKLLQKPSPQKALRRALDGMLPALELAYAQGSIRTESDLNYAIVGFLQVTLRRPATRSRWVVGANHSLFGVRPDVVCYFVDRPFVEFIEGPETCLVGVVEIKFASDIHDDLGKLTRVQKEQDILAWMVYGDHFCQDVHASNFRAQQSREKKICEWVRARPDRGASILKCGKLHESPRLRSHKDVILAYNSNWWIRDNK